MAAVAPIPVRNLRGANPDIGASSRITEHAALDFGLLDEGGEPLLFDCGGPLSNRLA